MAEHPCHLQPKANRGAASYGLTSSSSLVNGISSPLLRTSVVAPLAAGAGHVAGGTTANLIAGQNIGDAFTNSFKGIGTAMLMGWGVGVASTVGVCYFNGKNPITGKMAYPSNDGFKGEANPAMLKKGAIIDRYGNDDGSFAAPQGTSFDARSLPPKAIQSPLNTYKVVVPIPVMQRTAAPSIWFNASGGGMQYQFAHPINYYVRNGYLIKY